MTKPTTGEQQSTDQTKEAMTLSEAIHIVQEAIAAEENRLKQFISSKEDDQIMLEGETSAGYYVQMMIDPSKVAKIMLDYWYPVYSVLREEAPQEMWDDIARMVGLDKVCGVDL